MTPLYNIHWVFVKAKKSSMKIWKYEYYGIVASPIKCIESDHGL